MSRFSEILNAAQSGTFRDVFPPLSKADFFAGDPAPIQAQMVLDKINEVLGYLADRNEFITAKEWREKRHGNNRDKSLGELVGGVVGQFVDKNGFICNQLTAPRIPNSVASIVRRDMLEPASDADNEKLWKFCEKGYTDGVLNMLVNMDVNLEYTKTIGANNGIGQTFTLLQMTAASGKSVITRMLAAAGADVAVFGKQGDSPLMLAAAGGYDDTVHLLVRIINERYEDDPRKRYEVLTQKSAKGRTPLSYAEDYCSSSTQTCIEQAITQAMLEIDLQKSDGGKLKLKPRIPAPARPVPAMAAVQEMLDAFGGKITREQLMLKPDGQATILRIAIIGGLLDKALGMLRASGGHLTKDDLLQREEGAEGTNLDLILKNGQIPALFKPEYWVGHVRDMQQVWLRVPTEHQALMDGNDGRPSFRRNLQQANAASARSLGGRAGIGGR